MRIDTLTSCLVAWYERNARDLPWRRACDPYAIWVSEIMLQQTQVKTVIPYWEHWMKVLPTVRSLANADEQQVLKLWEGLGYYSRARNLQKAARVVCELYNGELPQSFEAIISLPGIGRYTAGAICSIAFGQPTPILDGNVVRVLSRLYAITGDVKSSANQAALWKLSASLVKAVSRRGACSSLNQALMELGATICLPREPRCEECPIAKRCIAYRTHRVSEFPQIAKRPKSRSRRYVALVLQRAGHVLVRKRPAGIVNADLWEFPNFETSRHAGNPLKTRWTHLEFRPFALVKHTITNNRITLRAFAASVNSGARGIARDLEAEWRAIEQLEALPFSSAHAKIRALLRADTQA